MKRLTLEGAREYIWTPKHEPFWDNAVMKLPSCQILFLQINVMEVSATQWYEWSKLFRHPLKWLGHRLCQNTSDYRIELSTSLKNDQMNKIVRRYFGSVWNDGEHLIKESIYADYNEPLYVNFHIDLAKGHILRYQIVATVFYK